MAMAARNPLMPSEPPDAPSNPLMGGNGGAPGLPPSGVVQPGTFPAVSQDVNQAGAGSQIRHGTSDVPHPIEGRNGFLRSYSQIEEHLDRHGVPYTTQMSNSNTAMHGPSSSVYFRIDHPTDPTTLRLSDHAYAPGDVDLRYGMPSHQAEALIGQRLGLPISSDAKQYIKDRDEPVARDRAKYEADRARNAPKQSTLDRQAREREAEAIRQNEIEINNARIRAEREAKRAARRSK
jgi:hypothetical protein